MTFSRSILMTSTMALIAATPALADLTAEQVLDDQLKQMQAYGVNAQVSSSSKDGNALTVDSYTATLEFPDGAFNMEIGGATFTEQDDGSVTITYPATIPVTLSGTVEDGEAFEMVLALAQTGMSSVVTGIPEDIRYEFVADSVSVAELAFTQPEEAAEMDLNVDMVVNGLSGFMAITGGGPVRDYTSEFNYASFGGTVSGTAPEDEGAFTVELNGEAVTSQYSGRMAPQEAMASFADTITAGSRTNGTATCGPLTISVTADTPDGNFEMASAMTSGAFDFNMDENGLDYGGVSKDMTLSLGGSVMQFPPMTFRMAETGGRFKLPVVPSEDAQDFAVLSRMIGLELDPMIWGMFDPTGQLPRDPANLVIDMDGSVVMSQDIFDPEVMESMAGAPGQIESVNVNGIELSFAGAELTGDGAFTFNNEGFMPMPAGAMNLMLVGGNTLLDKLVGMGLLPQEQAMGARMMMGLFARPGAGEDTLVSTIEVKEDGSVLANGQRIQ